MANQIPTQNECEKCPLRGRPRVLGSGPRNKYMIIGEAPGYYEVARGQPFAGESGTLLRKSLEAVGINPETEVYYTNAVLCHPEANATPGVTIWRSCRERLIREIEEVNPRKILSVGGVPLSSLTDGVETAITKARGIGRWLNGRYWLPTLHPASVLRQTDYFRDFIADLHKLSIRDEPIPPPRILEQIVENSGEALGYLELLLSASSISFDLETTGLDFLSNEIVSFGFGAFLDDPDYDILGLIIPKKLVDSSSELKEGLKSFVEEYEGPLILHNAKFDLQFLDIYYGVPIVPKQTKDTMLMAYALDERPEGRYAGHSLKSLAARYDIPSYKFNFDALYKIPEGERDYSSLFSYQTVDCAVTLKLFGDLKRELEAESDKLMPLVDDVLVPGTLAYAQIEEYGVLIDVEHFQKARLDLKSELDQLLTKLQDSARSFGLHEDPIEFNVDDWEEIKRLLILYPRDRELITTSFFEMKKARLIENEYTYNRYMKSLLARAGNYGLYSEGIPFNPNAPKPAKELVASLGVVAKSTEREVLWLAMANTPNLPESHRDIIETLIDYRMKSKILSTFVEGLLNSKDSRGRVHPDYLLHGTATGRPSCTNPNLQNIPQVAGPLIRDGFIAPDDAWFVSVDYSQLELRVAASLANDEIMIDAYRDGRDIHVEVASKMFKKPPEEITYFERYLAKYVDFGVIYGRGSKSLVEGWEMEHLAQLGGKRWSLREADEFIEAFLNGFPGLKQWIRIQQDLVHENQYVETWMGRRRRFPLILRTWSGSVERQAVNTPIQSLASDLTLTALIRLHKRLDPSKVRLLFTVYDSIAFEIKKGTLSEIVPIIKYEMAENLPVSLPCPIRVDIEVGHRWGKLEKYDPERHQ